MRTSQAGARVEPQVSLTAEQASCAGCAAALGRSRSTDTQLGREGKKNVEGQAPLVPPLVSTGECGCLPSELLAAALLLCRWKTVLYNLYMSCGSLQSFSRASGSSISADATLWSDSGAHERALLVSAGSPAKHRPLCRPVSAHGSLVNSPSLLHRARKTRTW